MCSGADVLISKFATLDPAHAKALDQAMALAAFDANGQLLHANTRYLQLLGYSAAQVRGLSHHSLCAVPVASDPSYAQLWHHVCAGPHSTHVAHRTRDGSPCWLQATYIPVSGADGQAHHILLVATATTPPPPPTDQPSLDADLAHLLPQAIQASDAAIVISDHQSRLLHVNAGFCRMYGWQPQDLQGQPLIQSLAPLLQSPKFESGYRTALSAGHTIEHEAITQGKHGQRYWVKAISTPVLDAQGHWQHTITVLTDITQSKIHETLQRTVLEAMAREQPLTQVLELVCKEVEDIAPDVSASILAVDAQQLLRPLAAPSLPTAFTQSVDGVPIGPAAGSCGTAAWRKASVMVNDIATDPLWAQCKTQILSLGYCACWSTPILGPQGQVLGTFAFYYRAPPSAARASLHQKLVDACTHLCALALEREDSRQRMRQLAHYDSVTGLPNRSLLMQQAQQALAGTNTPDTHAAVLLIDLDRFKPVNDSLGHHAGDSLLRTIAGRIKQFAGGQDLAGRLSGDEFVLVLPQCDTHTLNSTIERLQQQLKEPMQVLDSQLAVTASIGVALHPCDGTEMETLLQHAGMALAQAKQAGRGLFRFFSSDMNARAQAHLVMENALRNALRMQQLQLHYQPQIHMRTGQLYGVEALARWTDPQLGPISPAQFIPLAEECGLIAELGHWALQEACRQLAQWRQQQLPVPSVSVNLSPSSFHNLALPDMIAATLAQHGLQPQDLTLELTESIALDNHPSTMTNIHAIRELGVRLSMDDFGTGYSSLSYLRRLPISELKLDRSFVADIEADHAARSLSSAIMGIGRSLDLTVVAEGIETTSQHQVLREQGYSVAQGYLFSRPLSAEDLLHWLHHNPQRLPTARD